jgi:signal transduction histidine kinase
MRQALLNLLLNAMQAMPSGGVVRLSVRREQALATVEIADNGAGIPAALLPRIFDLYFTTKPRGSGIGLAMTYRIVQLHGGAMEVRSDADPASPHRGTIFTLHIPISVAPASEERKAPPRLAGSRDADNSAHASSDAHVPVATGMDGKEIA